MSRTARIAASATLLVVFITGCSSVRNPGETIANLPAAPMPIALPGDHYWFDDGHIERVQRITADGVHWRIANGEVRQVTYVDYTIPPYEWETPEGLARQTVTSSVPSLWPVAEGKSARHQAQLAINSNGITRNYAQTWRCNVTDSQRLSLPAGPFNTHVITCTRRSESGYHGHTQTWYHAPALGHWVRKLDRTQGTWRTNKQRDLVSFRQVPRWLGLLGASKHEAQLQKSLENLQTGQAAELSTSSPSNPNLVFKTYIIVARTYITQSRKICRDVQLHDTESSPYSASFCRLADEWVMSRINSTHGRADAETPPPRLQSIRTRSQP